MLLQDDLSLYNAPADARGGMRHLHFTSPDRRLSFGYDATYNDIGWIKLEQSLKPGEQIELTTPFTVKVPLAYSRLARAGDAYHITQWYPQIAVHDEQGWHAMPYLDLGEFFADFADYYIEITLPKGYTIAATGHVSTV